MLFRSAESEVDDNLETDTTKHQGDIIDITTQKNTDPVILLPLVTLIIICLYFEIFAAQGELISQQIAETLTNNNRYIQTVLNK